MKYSCSLMLVLLAAFGCGQSVEGPERRAVEGVVTFKKTPLPAGLIKFIPQAGGPVTTALISEGKFSCAENRGVPVGIVRVEIEATSNVSEDQVLAGKAPPLIVIPLRYNAESVLKESVPDGEELLVMNFDLDG